jgi:hypothetical protein
VASARVRVPCSGPVKISASAGNLRPAGATPITLYGFPSKISGFLTCGSPP